MEKKQEIIEAAQKLFSQFGVKKVTMDEISRAAHISKATAYKYFKDKYQIFREVVELETDQLLQAINEAVETSRDVEGKFKAHLKTKLGKIHEVTNFYRVTNANWDEHWPYIAEARDRFMLEEKEIIINIIQCGVESGELKVHNIELTAHIIVVAQKSLEFPWAANDQKISVDELVEQMLKILLNGIKNSKS